MAEEDLTRETQAHEDWEEDRRRARRRSIYERSRFEGLQIDPEIDFYPEVADREPGDRNIVRWGFDLHPQVTFWAAGILIVFIFLTLVDTDRSGQVFNDVLGWVGGTWGWLYIFAGNIFVLACAFFAFSRFGKIRIGGPEAQPEFTNLAWYSMLVSAGMGIGLMFWGVGEPIWHTAAPAPFFEGVLPNTIPAAKAGLATTYYHWGLHPWAIYALVSLALAFFAYNRGLPLTFRSVFYPLLKEKIYGGWGNAIDVLTVLATLFGLAASLGLGVQQANAGLNFLFGAPVGAGFQVVLIAGITALAVMSVVAGLDAGVKRLSQLNMFLAGALVVFVLIVGPTLFILSLFPQSVGEYIGVLPQISFWVESAFEGGIGGTDWQTAWTLVYWGWWISWSPFVGMFIARISKGRSVRELVLGVVVVPSLLSFFWFAVFGGAALNLQLGGVADIATAVTENVNTALFVMLEEFPLTQAVSLVAVLLIVTFFITSSDSGSLVVDHLTSGGKLDSPRTQRVFWAVMEGAVASVLLLGGGLTALQTAAISTGLPFALVLLFLIWSLMKAFSEELDMLEDHYDAAQFRSRRAGFMERVGKGEVSVPAGSGEEEQT